MQQKQPRVQLATSAIAILGVTAYRDLKTDDKGFKIHSGLASGGQEVKSLKSKIEQGKDGKPATITIKASDGQGITLFATEAEVLFAQSVKPLSKLNRTATSAA